MGWVCYVDEDENDNADSDDGVISIYSTILKM